jgi:hypothetical protein
VAGYIARPSVCLYFSDTKWNFRLYNQLFRRSLQGDDSQGGGGGSDILSLLTTLLGGSSGVSNLAWHVYSTNTALQDITVIKQVSAELQQSIIAISADGRNTRWYPKYSVLVSPSIQPLWKREAQILTSQTVNSGLYCEVFVATACVKTCDGGTGVYIWKGTTSRVMAADRAHVEFDDCYNVILEYSGYTIVNCMLHSVLNAQFLSAQLQCVWSDNLILSTSHRHATQ